MKCSDFIAKYLKDCGISVVFDYSGGMIINLEDSINKLDGIDCVPVRHEQAAGFAAEGYSRVSGNFGVAIATSGPGSTNMMTPIGSCYFDSTPALFITGQVNSADIRSNKNIRQNGFQELDVIELVQSLTKYAKLITDPNDILYELEKCICIMKSGRPGPVVLDLPFNIQATDINPPDLKKYLGSKEHQDYLAEIENFKKNNVDPATLIKDSKAPVILYGNGIKLSKTGENLIKFSEHNNLPVVSSLMGLGEFPSDHKNFIGFIGTYGNRPANIILANADLILVLGSRIDLRQTGNPKLFAQNATIVHVDIDEYSVKNSFKNYLFINEDIRNFFQKYREMKTDKKDNWLSFCNNVKSEFNDTPSQIGDGHCSPNKFFEEFSHSSPENSVVIADVGQNQMWLAQSWSTKKGQSLIFSGGMGSMGFCLPASIGVYLADITRPVFAFMGDGGFQMNIQELETIKLNQFPIKIIVLNNYSLGMVREFQDEYLKNKNRQSTVVGYSCPDIKKISDAYGIKYFRLENNDDLQKMYSKFIDLKEPAILEVKLSVESSLRPKVVYGHTIENQSPFLSEEKQEKLSNLKRDLLS